MKRSGQTVSPTSARAEVGVVAGVAFCLLSATAFSMQGVFARWAYERGASTPTVGGFRFAIAALLLWTIVFGAGNPGRKIAGSVPLRTGIALLALGAVGYFLGSLTYLAAVTTIPVSLAGLLLYSYPAIATGFAVLLGQDRATLRLVAGLVLALAGVTLTLGAPAISHATHPDPRGVALVLLSALLYSGYIVGSERVLKDVNAVVAMAYIATGATVSFAVLLTVTGTFTPSIGAAGWSAIGGMALISTVIAAGMFLSGLRRLGPARAATISTVEPLITVLVAGAFLGERLQIVQLVGGGIILAGVLLVIRERRGPVGDEHPA